MCEGELAQDQAGSDRPPLCLVFLFVPVSLRRVTAVRVIAVIRVECVKKTRGMSAAPGF